jgi:hypothetical protein
MNSALASADSRGRKQRHTISLHDHLHNVTRVARIVEGCQPKMSTAELHRRQSSPIKRKVCVLNANNEHTMTPRSTITTNTYVQDYECDDHMDFDEFTNTLTHWSVIILYSHIRKINNDAASSNDKHCATISLIFTITQRKKCTYLKVANKLRNTTERRPFNFDQ